MAREHSRARSPHVSSELHKLTPRRVSERLQQRVPARAQDWEGRCAKCGVSYRAVHLVTNPAICLPGAHLKGTKAPVHTKSCMRASQPLYSHAPQTGNNTSVLRRGQWANRAHPHNGAALSRTLPPMRPCASHHDPVSTAGSQGDRPHTA